MVVERAGLLFTPAAHRGGMAFTLMRLLCGLSLLLPVLAQEEKKTKPGYPEVKWDIEEEDLRQVFESMDNDNDGKVSKREAAEYHDRYRRAASMRSVETQMTHLDKNKDGKLSMEEFTHLDQAYAKETEQEKFKAADKNEDGYLDSKELFSLDFEDDPELVKLEVQMTFNRMDPNRNGLVSFGEFLKWHDFEDEEIEHRGLAKEMFMEADKDGDEKLSFEEMLRWRTELLSAEKALVGLFDIADVDTDQHLTIDELLDRAEHISEHHLAYGTLDDWTSSAWKNEL